MKSEQRSVSAKIKSIINLVTIYCIVPIITYLTSCGLEKINKEDLIALCILIITIILGIAVAIIGFVIVFDGHILSSNEAFKLLIIKIKELQVKDVQRQKLKLIKITKNLAKTILITISLTLRYM